MQCRQKRIISVASPTDVLARSENVVKNKWFNQYTHKLVARHENVKSRI